MKKFRMPILAGLTLLLAAFTFIQVIDWQIANGYAIKISGSGVQGEFKTMHGTISFDEKDLASAKFSTSIDAASINTGNFLKTIHAKSDNWLDAKKYPNIIFVSSKFSKSNNGYRVVGALTLHGITKQIVIPFTFDANVFKGNFSVNRMDYGIGDMKGFFKIVSNEIKLDISVPVIKK